MYPFHGGVLVHSRMRRFSRPLLFAAGLAAASTSSAVEQSRAQQRCVKDLLSGGSEVAALQGGANLRCVRNLAIRPASTPGLAECLADASSRVTAAASVGIPWAIRNRLRSRNRPLLLH